ncbi:MAG TPA: trypsin-like serine protease [Polyangiaceae bacterium]|nr:trypsin-like serine protease [Polyangiaceae bacterium]
MVSISFCRFSGSVALGLLAFGCGQQSSEPALGHLSQPMIDGQPSDSAYDDVVFVQTKQSADSSLACTGTLIAPNLVITALHCVTSSTLGDFTCKSDGTMVATNVQDGTFGSLVAPGNVKVYAGSPVDYSAPIAVGAHLVGSGSTQACQGDLALVQLDRNVDLPVATLRLDKLPTYNEQADVLGYGATETANSEGLRLLRQVQVLDVGPSSTAGPLRTTPPRTFVVGEGPCKGDSGGPAFDTDSHALLGVFSLNTAASCDLVGIHNVYTALSPYSKTILAAFKAAGADPVLETPLPDAGVAAAPSKDSGGCSLSSAPPSAAPSGHAPFALISLAALACAGLVRRRRAP